MTPGWTHWGISADTTPNSSIKDSKIVKGFMPDSICLDRYNAYGAVMLMELGAAEKRIGYPSTVFDYSNGVMPSLAWISFISLLI